MSDTANTNSENNRSRSGQGKGSRPLRHGSPQGGSRNMRNNNYKGQRNGSSNSNRKGGYKGPRKDSFRSSDRNRSNDEGSFSDKPANKYQGKRFASAGERRPSGEHTWSHDDRRPLNGDRRSNNSRPKNNGRRFDENRRFDDKRRDDNDRRPYDRARDERTSRNDHRVRFNDKRQGAADKSLGEKQSGTQAKKRVVYKNKKAFDQQKVATLMDAETSAYRGELDPKRNERSQIAPGRKTREMRELKEDAERQKATEERRERDAIDDITVPAEKRFYKNDASPARLAALDVTRAVRKRNAYANELISSRIDNSDLSSADRAFATLLVLGVVSTYGTLDEIINRGMKKPTDAFDDVRDALRISTYEIMFLDKSPHAALDQGVEMVRAISPSAAGLGNAILHRILEMKPEFPFGDPNHDINALARVYAFPKWMARKLVEDMGAKEAAALMHASNEPAPLFISVNSLKASDEEVIAAFEAEGASLRPAQSQSITVPGCYHVSNPRAIAAPSILSLFDEGKILVSDASAQAVADALFDNAQPASILEIGAGRGTKTILIQSAAQRLLGHQIQLTPLDLHEYKIELLKKRAETYGVELTDPVAGNGTRLEPAIGNNVYDTVFIDAPCSGLGTLRRHPEIRWRINESHIGDLADAQVSILKNAANHVASKGQLVYATCTVTYDENNGVVKRFLESPEGKSFKLVPLFGKPCFSSMLTDGSPDAHFAVKFERID